MESRTMVTRKYWRAGIVAAIAIGMLAPSAGAAPKRTRKTHDIKVEATDATKKLEPKKTGPVERTKEISADDFFTIEASVQDINDQLIKIYQRQLENANEDDPRLPEYAFRLAEAFAQKVRYYNFKKMEALMKADQAKKQADKTKHKREASAAEKEEQAWLVKTVSAYKAIVDSKNPVIKKFARMDEVLFYFAYTL